MSEKNQEVKEIDLLELFSLIGKGIKNAFLGLIKAILFVIVFGVKRAHYLLLFAAIGGGIGWIVYSGSQRFYSSELIAQPNGINVSDMVNYINDLNKFCEKNNKPALSYALNLPDTVGKKIKNIEAYFYIDLNGDDQGDIIDFNHSFNAKDSTQKIDDKRFYLKVEVFDNQLFNNVRDGIFYYISANPYLIKLNELRKKELNELISQTEKEILKLDSLQNVDYFKSNSKLSSTNDNRLMFLSEKDKPMYYIDKISLINQKQRYSKELDLATTPITVIKDFTQLSKEENPIGKYIILFGFWFGVGGYLLILIMAYLNKIKEFIK
jgi:hypothetical protein